MGLTVCAAAHDAGASASSSDTRRQLRFGVLAHDLRLHDSTEEGWDAILEYRGAPFAGSFWRTVLSPRPHIGANISGSGRTSSLYAGLSWRFDFESAFYVSADFGVAGHDGKLERTDPDRAALGSRVLFHEAAELGVRLGRFWRAGIRADHMSNADLTSPNDGITNVGVVFTRDF